MAPVRLMDWLVITTSLDVKSSVAKDPPHVRGDGNRGGHSRSGWASTNITSFGKRPAAMRTKIGVAGPGGKYTS